MHYGPNGQDRHTLEEIGHHPGTTRERVRQIELRALELLSRRSEKVKGRKIIKQYKAGNRNFSRVTLRRADLEGADLRNINLSLAYLGQANLHNANLIGANLTGCDLIKANLRNADLANADLRRANLYKADVTSAQLAQAKSLEGAILPDGGRHE